jgi:hypothetical protein
VRMTLDDPRFLMDLLEFLSRARVAAKAGKSGSVFVELPAADDSAHARVKLKLIVTGWEAMNPGAGVAFAEQRPGLPRTSTRRRERR